MHENCKSGQRMKMLADKSGTIGNVITPRIENKFGPLDLFSLRHVSSSMLIVRAARPYRDA